jgi:hypothetical protein
MGGNYDKVFQTTLLILMVMALMYSAYTHGEINESRKCLAKLEKVNNDLAKIEIEYKVWKKYLSK